MTCSFKVYIMFGHEAKKIEPNNPWQGYVFIITLMWIIFLLKHTLYKSILFSLYHSHYFLIEIFCIA